MMSVKMFLKLFFVLAIVSPTLAHAVCFQDQSTYNAVKSELPPLLRGGSLTLVHTSKSLLAGVRIFKSGSKFRVETHVWHSLMGIDQQESTVSKICVDGRSAKVLVDGGNPQKMELHDSTVVIRGYPFRPGNRAEFISVVEKIGEKN